MKGRKPKPATMTPAAAAEWRRIIPILREMGLLARSDSTIIGSYCESVARLAALTAQLAGGFDVAVSRLAMQETALLKGLAGELCLSPAGRSRARMPQKRPRSSGEPTLAEFMRTKPRQAHFKRTEDLLRVFVDATKAGDTDAARKAGAEMDYLNSRWDRFERDFFSDDMKAAAKSAEEAMRANREYTRGLEDMVIRADLGTEAWEQYEASLRGATAAEREHNVELVKQRQEMEKAATAAKEKADAAKREAAAFDSRTASIAARVRSSLEGDVERAARLIAEADEAFAAGKISLAEGMAFASTIERSLLGNQVQQFGESYANPAIERASQEDVAAKANSDRREKHDAAILAELKRQTSALMDAARNARVGQKEVVVDLSH